MESLFAERYKGFGDCAEVCHQIGTNAQNECYYDHLASLNLPSLQYQHKHIDMIITYKIIHGLVDISFSDLIIQQLNLMVISYSNNCVYYSSIRFHSFSQRVVNDWNSLPADIVDTLDVDS